MTSVLIVEDDIDLGHLLKQYLKINNFEAHRVFNGEEARNELLIHTYDILILDVTMPKEDGFTLAGKISQLYPSLPFLFITARKMKEDILHGLQLGADDYILKPFDVDELILRVKNILKRTERKEEGQHKEHLSAPVYIGSYKFDPGGLLLTSRTSDTILTEKEARLLQYLYQHKNALSKRADILHELWGEADFFNGRSLDVFISRLRKLLAEDKSIQIESIRGVGYRFIAE